MTTVHLPDLRGKPPDSHYLGWYALSKEYASVPTLGEARRCAESGLQHAACTLRVVAFDPADGATLIGVPPGPLSIDVEVLPAAPPDTTPVLRITDASGAVVDQLEGQVEDACRTRVHFDWKPTSTISDGTYRLALAFRSAAGVVIEPADNSSHIVVAFHSAPSLPHDPCAITLASAVQVVLPTLDPPLLVPPRPPLLALTHDGCEVAAWSTHASGLLIVPNGLDGLDVLTSPCGGLAFHLASGGAGVRDAIFWGDAIAVLFADHVALFDLRGCSLVDPFEKVDGGIALGIADDGSLLVVSRTNAQPEGKVRVFRRDGSELEAPQSFDARGWYARHRSAGFVYDAESCEYLLDPSQVASGCCIYAPRLLTDDESLFFRYVDDLATLRTRPAFARQGEVILGPNQFGQPLDAGRPDIQWHRVVLFGEIPPGCIVRIETRATNDILAADPVVPDGWSDPVEATPISIVPVESPEDEREAAADALVLAGPGRYLGIRLTLLGNGRASPRITAIEIEQPRDGISQYLPQVFRDSTPEDDFLRRWLALFEQTAFDGVAARMDDYAGLFDPETAPEELLPFLAGWLQILDLARLEDDPGRFRRVLSHAAELARTRGTPAGLELAVMLYMGIPIHVVEGSRTGSDFFLGAGATADGVSGTILGCQTVLSREASPIDLGDEPRLGCGFLLECDDRVGYFPWHFDVWVPARCVCTSDDLALLRRIIEVEKPAHTTYSVRQTGAAGWVLGVESVVGQDRSAEFDQSVCDPATFGITLLNGPLRSPPLGVGLVLGRDSRLPGAPGPELFELDESGARLGQTSRVGQ